MIKFKSVIFPEFLLVFSTTGMTHSYCSLSNCHISNITQVVFFPDFFCVFCSARMTGSYCRLKNCHNYSVTQIAIFLDSIKIHALPLSKVSIHRRIASQNSSQSDPDKSVPLTVQPSAPF